MGLDEVFCAKCGQGAHFKCERCLEPYCTSQCQINDWQDHKSKCYKFPNLIPINMLKSFSGLHFDKVGGNLRRHHGSAHNLNETRRSSTNVNYNKAKPKPLLNDDDFNMVPKASSATSKVPAVKFNSERPITWRDPFPPSDGFFDAMVQFKEEIESEKRIVWVTDLKYGSSLRKLLSEINRTINQKCPCSGDDIYQGALVAAPLDKMLYRAEVLETFPDIEKATIRLIDYGNELRVPNSQLFAPIPIMCNLNAYAFRVCLPNDYGPVEIESIVTIKILGEKHTENYYNVECKMKSISLNLPIELFNKEHILKFVKCFSDGRNALLRLCSVDGVDQEFNNLLNSPESLNFEFESLPKVGSFVAARTHIGWKRARLLGLYEKQHMFLIYAIDEGFISFSLQIKKVPEAFITQSIRVFAISTNSTNCMISDAMLSTANNLTLQLLPASRKDSTNLECGLFDDDRKIVDLVTVSVFTGLINDLGVKLWHDRIYEGDNVIISHVLTYKEIYIASQQNNEYPKIFMAEYSKCIPFAADEKIENGDVVMYCNNEGDDPQYCRGQIIIKCENKQFKIMDIDRCSEQVIARNALRKPTLLVCSLPVRCIRVSLMFLESIPTPVANNKALEALETCMQNAVQFDVTFNENKSVDLLFRTKEKQSLCKKLLPMVFEPATKQTTTPVSKLPENTSLQLSPPNTPIVCQHPTVTLTDAVNVPEVLDAVAAKVKLFTIDDLEVIPITCGEKVPLYVLDPSTIMNIENPYITAADYNKEFLAKMEQFLKVVGDYCKNDKAPRNGYAPKKMEICLSVFPDDGEWYRALCVDHKPNDMFVVMFLDYGNIAKVNKMDIMPMVSDLMFPSNANMVYLEGITNTQLALSFMKSFEKNPLIYANVRRVDSDAYTARICV